MALTPEASSLNSLHSVHTKTVRVDQGMRHKWSAPSPLCMVFLSHDIERSQGLLIKAPQFGVVADVARQH